MSIRRRAFLAIAGTAAAASVLPLAWRQSQSAAAASRWGPLVADPKGIMALPPGFSYTVLERKGDPMDDGYVVPGRPDGMACFEDHAGNWVLMRNHENGPGDASESGWRVTAPAEAYNPLSYGGVSRVVIDPKSGARVSSNLVLAGTMRNCAGGPSPWGWLSCEETTSDNHGYVFLCDIEANAVQPPDRKAGYGRYRHEAVAVDPATNIAYLTEDREQSCLFRFLPTDASQPFAGQLQALKVTGTDQFNTGAMNVGDAVRVEWIDVAHSEAGDGVHEEAQGNGAANVVRGEGTWFDETAGALWVCSTTGGPIGKGQIFRLIDGASATLELVAQSTNVDELDMPDNICVAPTGEVYMGEDGGGETYIRYIDLDGMVRDFGRNALSSSELAGVCFSPDGTTLFVNIQDDGLTLAIKGPFSEGGAGDGVREPSAPHNAVVPQ